MIFHPNHIFQSEIEKINWVSGFFVFFAKKQRFFIFSVFFIKKWKNVIFGPNLGFWGGIPTLGGAIPTLGGPIPTLWGGIPMFGFGANWADFAVLPKSDKNFGQNWKCNKIWSFLHFFITFLWFSVPEWQILHIWCTFYINVPRSCQIPLILMKIMELHWILNHFYEF